MSDHFIEPATDHVIVAELPRTTVIDGIEMPDNEKQQEMVFGSVVYVGPDAHRTHESDTVCYGPFAGKHVIIDGMQFRLMREGQIEMYLRKKQ
jgi:co-chaperonin GroES (HSP10)